MRAAWLCALTAACVSALTATTTASADDSLGFGRLLLSDEERLEAEAERQGRPPVVAASVVAPTFAAEESPALPLRLQGVMVSSRGRQHQWWQGAGEREPRGMASAAAGVVRLRVEGRAVDFRVGQTLEQADEPLREIYLPPPVAAQGGGGAGGPAASGGLGADASGLQSGTDGVPERSPVIPAGLNTGEVP